MARDYEGEMAIEEATSVGGIPVTPAGAARVRQTAYLKRKAGATIAATTVPWKAPDPHRLGAERWYQMLDWQVHPWFGTSYPDYFFGFLLQGSRLWIWAFVASDFYTEPPKRKTNP